MKNDFSPRAYNLDALRKMSPSALTALAGQLRGDILHAVAKNGGHLASNLGAVELTIALHRQFDSPRDSILFDVGHQAYAHKLLTGRGDGFEKLRREGGVSGFTTRSESEHDPVTGGHSGAAISSALGIAEAKGRLGSPDYTIVVVGDGSFTNGMVYEALNNCTPREGREHLRLIIVLNDNEMSISPNVGGLSNYFSRIRLSEGYFAFKSGLKRFFSHVPLLGRPLLHVTAATKELLKRLLITSNMFENLGLEYLGPVNGHDIAALERVFAEAKRRNTCCLVHIKTVKGKGYPPAEAAPCLYHSTGPFPLDGEPETPEVGVAATAEAEDIIPRGNETFSKACGSFLCDAATENDRVCAVTAAMAEGTGLSEFSKRYPDRFFDVGIAEEHAVTFTGGLSLGGMKPVCALYSSFAQRAFDQIWHDLAMQGAHAVLALDRAGLVGGDGRAHQGLDDCALLAPVPGIAIYSPDSIDELRGDLRTALDGDGVTVLRYPRGGECVYDRGAYSLTENCAYRDAAPSPDTAIITYGRLAASTDAAARILASRPASAVRSGRLRRLLRELPPDPPALRLIRLRRVHPLPTDELRELLRGIDRVFFVEEGTATGGVGERFAALCAEGAFGAPPRVSIRAVSDGFVPHADLASLDRRYGFLPSQLAEEWKKDGHADGIV